MTLVAYTALAFATGMFLREHHLTPPVATQASSVVGRGKASTSAFARRLSRHGYTLWTSYQPASRFWSFQWIETTRLLALSALLISATVWLVHRRAT